jgi:hypothetical protein
LWFDPRPAPVKPLRNDRPFAISENADSRINTNYGHLEQRVLISVRGQPKVGGQPGTLGGHIAGTEKPPATTANAAWSKFRSVTFLMRSLLVFFTFASFQNKQQQVKLKSCPITNRFYEIMAIPISGIQSESHLTADFR